MRIALHFAISAVFSMGLLALLFVPSEAHAIDCDAAQQEQETYCELLDDASSPEYISCMESAWTRYNTCLESDSQEGYTVTQAQRDSCTAASQQFTTGCYAQADGEDVAIIAGCDVLNSNFDQCAEDARQTIRNACDRNALIGFVRCVTRQLSPEAPTTPPPGAADQAAGDQPRGPAQTGPVSESYNQILEHGIIFANICKNTAESPCPCRDDGDCTVQDILQFVVNIMNFILAISGTLVLLMFLYGGFTWLTSAGNSDAVSRGRGAMTAAVVGLVIIFSSYAIIVFVVTVLTDEELGQSSLEDLVDGEDIFQTQ
jgi:hypothetical protein